MALLRMQYEPGDWWARLSLYNLTQMAPEHDDHLFRISPDTLRITLSYKWGPLRVQLEQVLVDEQDRISTTNTLQRAMATTAWRSRRDTVSPTCLCTGFLAGS